MNSGAMRLSVLNDRTSPILPDGSQATRYQDSSISARNSQFPASSGRIPSWQLLRILPDFQCGIESAKAVIGPACWPGSCAHPPPLCGGWRACRTAATNIKFSGRSGCSPTSAVHTLCRVWQLRKGDRAAQKPKKAAAGFRCLTPPLYGIATRTVDKAKRPSGLARPAPLGKNHATLVRRTAKRAG